MNDDVVRVARTDIARTALAPRAALVLPRLIVDAGPAAVEKFLEFFAARIAGFKHRLLGLQTRQSEAYKGMMALLMQAGSADFINGDVIELTTFFDQAVEIHHIFPRSHCEEQGYPLQKWNSVVNKTPITARTNRFLGGNAPSDYLTSIETNHRVESHRLDQILATHLIEPSLLRADAFDAFIIARARQLLDLVEKAIGKAVVGRDTADVVTAFGSSLSVDAPVSTL